MFRAFDEKLFRQAIIDKNYKHLKINTVSALRFDPTFEKGEAKRVLEILDNEVPEIFEEYKQEEYEEPLSKEEWDRRYFSKITYWFQENFAKERIDYIKEVGKTVFPPYKESTIDSYNSSQSTKKQFENSESNKKTKEKNNYNSNPQRASEKKFPVAGALATAGALVLVGLLLYKILSN